MADAPRGAGSAVGVHERGRGPGDSFSLPYFAVAEMTARRSRRVEELGGSVIHPGERWAICRDSEGSPFGLAASGGPAAVEDEGLRRDPVSRRAWR